MPTYRVTPLSQWVVFWVNYVVGLTLTINGHLFWSRKDWITGHLFWSRAVACLIFMAGVTQLMSACGTYLSIRRSQRV